MPATVGYPNPKRTTGEVGENLVRVARSRFEHGRTFRTNHRESEWKQSEMQYGGDHWGVARGPQDPTADLVVVNLSFSTISVIVPYVTGSDPKFLVEPYSGDATVRNARAQGAWLNRFWRAQDSGARRAVNRAAHDNLIYGDAWGKVTYEFKPAGDFPSPDDLTPVDVEESETPDEIAILHVDAISPWDVWVDPMSDGLHNARWIAQRSRFLLHELKADKTYQNLDQVAVGLEPSTADDQDRRYDIDPPKADDEVNENAWVEIIEFWDLRKRELVVFALNGDLPIKVVEQTECPIVALENHWLPKQPYHMGDLEQIWALQMELNKSRSQMLTHRRRNIAKYLVKSDALDEGAEAALVSEIVGDMVKIKGDKPLDDVIKAVASSPLSADAYNVSDLITRDVYEITGVNEYLRGATPQIRRTATEATIMEGSSNIKSAHKLGKIEEFVRDLGTLVLKVAADVFPLTKYDELQIYITGRDAEALNRAEQGEKLTALLEQGADPDIIAREQQGADLYGAAKLEMGPDIFVGVYQVEVVQNSTELRNPIFKEQKYREMAKELTAAAPALMQQGVQLNLRKVYELWFEAAGIQDIDDLFTQIGGQFPPGMPQPPGAGGALSGMGMPNLAGLGAPNELLSALNTGALPPEGEGPMPMMPSPPA